MNDSSSNLIQAKYGPELECSICNDLFFKPVSMNCGHTFCKECLQAALKVKPMCPLCRAPIFVQDINIKENITLRTLIENTYKDHVEQRSKKSEEKEIKQIIFKSEANEPKKFENFITLKEIGRPNTFLFPGTVMNLKFAFVGNLELLNFICPNKKFVCLPQGVVSTKPFLAYSVECLEFLKPDNSNILQARVRVLDRLKVEKLSEFESENADILKNFQVPGNFKFSVSQGFYLNDDHTQLDENKTKTLAELVQYIGDFFRQLLNELNTRSQNFIYRVLMKIGENNMPLLFSPDPNLFTSIQNIERFSMLASGLIKCNPETKHRLFETTSILERLVVLKSCIDNFHHINDPLMCIELEVPSQKLFTPFYSIIIIICIFVYLFFYKR